MSEPTESKESEPTERKEGERSSTAAAFHQAPFASPAGFLRTAIVIAALFAIAHAAGLREHTRFLSGTEPSGSGGEAEMALGILYTLLYFAFVLAAPIFTIGALVLAGLNRALAARGGRPKVSASRP